MAEDNLIVMEKARACSGRSDNRVPSNQGDGWQAARGGKPFPAQSNSDGSGCERQHGRPPKMYFRPESGLALHNRGYSLFWAARIHMAHSCIFGWTPAAKIKVIQLPAGGGPAMASGPEA
jgi:hypothetical protein